MYLRYQELSKVKQYSFLLKYDGMRKKNVYTIRAFDGINPFNVHGKDTDTPSEELDVIFNKIGIHQPSSESSIYNDFALVLKSLISKYGDKGMYSLSIKLTPELSFNLYISHNDFSVENSNIDDLIALALGIE